MRTVLCQVFFQDGACFNDFRGFVVSPKTGRKLHLDTKHIFHYPTIVSIIRNSCPGRGGYGKASLTVKDLQDLFFCPDSPVVEAEVCYAGREDMDGECDCSKCHERINSDRYRPGLFQVMNGDMG